LQILEDSSKILVILVLPILCTILVNTSIAVGCFILSAILEDTGHCQNMTIEDSGDSGKYWLYQYCKYWNILENTGYTSIADTGRFWKILVIPVLQILEDSGKYWSYQYCRNWKISYEVAECTCILLFCSVCASVMRGRTGYRETRRKETRAGRKKKRGGGRKKREGRKVKRGRRNEKRGERKEKRGGRMDKRTPVHPSIMVQRFCH
jgi:hypothetical protein